MHRPLASRRCILNTDSPRATSGGATAAPRAHRRPLCGPSAHVALACITPWGDAASVNDPHSLWGTVQHLHHAFRDVKSCRICQGRQCSLRMMRSSVVLALDEVHLLRGADLFREPCYRWHAGVEVPVVICECWRCHGGQDGTCGGRSFSIATIWR